jgi:hypothetical protein
VKREHSEKNAEVGKPLSRSWQLSLGCALGDMLHRPGATQNGGTFVEFAWHIEPDVANDVSLAAPAHELPGCEQDSAVSIA